MPNIRAYLNPKYLKNPIITGTFFLTAAGIITKLIGFFYRIFLSRLFSEESLGIFGLTAPVMILVHSVCAAGIQSAITRYVAIAESSREDLSPCLPHRAHAAKQLFSLRARVHKKEHSNDAYGFLFTGTAISILLSGAMSYAVFNYAPFIAINIIEERRCIPLLRISALSFPLATIHNCVNGFFYGQKRAAIPAWSMIIEQVCRVATVYALCSLSVNAGLNISLSYICLGLVAGEFSSAVFSCLMLALRPGNANAALRGALSFGKGKAIISLAAPISLNRLCISFLSTIETIQLPKMLVAGGLASSEALSIYGVFSGMAAPLILFPSAVTAAVSSLLLPSVSEAQAQGNSRRIRRIVYTTTVFCAALGLFCQIFFFTFADFLGQILFDSPIAASQIRALSFVCPFLYLSGALCSILHGLGKTGLTFIFNLASLLMRLGFVFTAVPAIGFSGYLYGTLISQIFFDLLIILALRKYLIYDRG